MRPLLAQTDYEASVVSGIIFKEIASTIHLGVGLDREGMYSTGHIKSELKKLAKRAISLLAVWDEAKAALRLLQPAATQTIARDALQAEHDRLNTLLGPTAPEVVMLKKRLDDMDMQLHDPGEAAVKAAKLELETML